MSPIAIGMDLMLAALLIGALWMGWRLNERLKALRASQADFAKAVMELDNAALRAETGLNALQSAAEEAHDSLLARIDTARSLAARLEKAEASAEGAARRAEAAAAEAKAIPQPVRERDREPLVREPHREPIRGLHPLRDIMASGPASARRDNQPEPRSEPRPELRPELRQDHRAEAGTMASPRRRHLADEALFADPDDEQGRSHLNTLMRKTMARK